MAGLLSLGVQFYCIEITREQMRGWLRAGPHPQGCAMPGSTDPGDVPVDLQFGQNPG
jgi:hypothetical protein